MSAISGQLHTCLKSNRRLTTKMPSEYVYFGMVTSSRMPFDWLLISREHVLINAKSNMGLPEADGREKEQEYIMNL